MDLLEKVAGIILGLFAAVVILSFMGGFLAMLWSGYKIVTNNDPSVSIGTVNVNSCEVSTATQRGRFILSCIKGANPNSDEEPEDWIGMCRGMAEKTFCAQETFQVTTECGNPSGCRVTSKVKVNLSKE